MKANVDSKLGGEKTRKKRKSANDSGKNHKLLKGVPPYLIWKTADDCRSRGGWGLELSGNENKWTLEGGQRKKDGRTACVSSGPADFGEPFWQAGEKRA